MKYLCCIFMLLFSTSIYAQEIQLANGEWLPFLSKDLKHYGFVSHIVSEAFKTVGVKTVYKFYPWKRAEALVEKGKIDGSLVWSIVPKREKFAYFSDPVISQKSVLFHLKSKPIKWNSIEDLYGYKIGSPLGSALGFFEEAVNNGKIKVHKTTNIETGFKTLLTKRIDIFPLGYYVGYNELAKHFSPDERSLITHSSKIIKTIEYRLMLSKAIPRNLEMLEKFNQGLKIITQNGQLEKMEKAFKNGNYEK